VIEIVREVPGRDELVELYGSVSWAAYTDQPDVLHQAVASSDFVATARMADRLVGLVRAISDDATIAYLQDVLVHPDHQRQGVGRLLVDAFQMRYGHVRQRVLLTDDEPSQLMFYEAMGFVRSDHVDGGALRAFVDFGRR
jgi:GNAT superfamily N-acetyltransferase